MSLVTFAFLCIFLCETSGSDPSACSPDGTLRPTALPQDPPLWSPSSNLNITITGLTLEGESALKLAFDQALVVSAAFNHDLGYNTLSKAYFTAASSSSTFQCCMCLWAMTYLNAPNINRNCAGDRLLHAQKAAQHSVNEGCLEINRDLERQLLTAMVARFPANRTSSNGDGPDKVFAQNMGEIVNQATDNNLAKADLQTLYAEATMNTWAWNYYTADSVSLRDEVKPAKDALEVALNVAPAHPLALHLTIHLFEPSRNPDFIETAVAAGDVLRAVIPKNLSAGIGHLIHMPGHAFTRSAEGRYHDAVLANTEGSQDDLNYIAECSVLPQDYYRQLYFSHKNAFLTWAAMMSGESEKALEAADRLLTECDIVNIADNLGGAFFSYPTWKVQALLKFGRFDDLIETPLPESTNNDLLDGYTNAMFFFARSIALASRESCIEAFENRIEFMSLAANTTLRNVQMFMIKVGDILDLTTHFLNGRLCSLCGSLEDDCSESKELAAAVEVQDKFPYMEPRYWPDNLRACLGAALLGQGDAEEALAVFEQDLSASQNPRNGWSLKGKELALRALGRVGEADKVLEEFLEAWQFADVDLLQPCF